jgi:Na+-translocating ferredoxin:NAD+ oxidoreductase RNF subunit RnfB
MATLSRRDFFSRFIPKSEETSCAIADARPKVAVIQGRYCLAYQNSFCSVCKEHCPVSGAIISERGIPSIVADACTGCNICHEVCPAPTNAILMIPKNDHRT